MTALWIALGFAGGRALRYLLNRTPTNPSRLARAHRRERSAHS